MKIEGFVIGLRINADGEARRVLAWTSDIINPFTNFSMAFQTKRLYEKKDKVPPMCELYFTFDYYSFNPKSRKRYFVERLKPKAEQ